MMTYRYAMLCLCLLLVGLWLVPGGSASAQDRQGTAVGHAEGKVTLDFKDIEITDLIQTISELTGKNFIYDDSVKGKVTIISPRSMTLDEAYQLFLTVLNVRDYTVVPSGQVNKIVPTKSAKESNLPTVTDGVGRAAENFVTRLIPLENIDANIMATTVLTPLIPKTSNIVAYTPSNTLVITDSAANIERLAKIIKQLDVPSSLELLEVIRLEFAGAEEVAQIAGQVISQSTTAPRRRRGVANVQAAGEKEVSKIIPYPRTNALVVMANAEDMETIKNLVKKLDQKQPQQRSHINVYYLENADAETLAKTLNEILTGIKTQARPTRQAQAAPVAQAAALVNEAVSITADKPTNSLIINATPEDYEVLREIIAQLDIKRKQVFVEALILELSMDATRSLGASLQGAVGIGDESVVFGTSNLNTGPVGLGSLTPATGTQFPSLLTQAVNGLLLGGLFSPITVTGPDGQEISVPALSALIDLSKTDSDVNILSAPRLLTSDNEEAEIVVGSNVPIITQRLTDTGGSTGLAQSVSVERKDVALTLRFTPQITSGDQVRLNVYQEITEIAQSSVGNINEVGPTFTKRLLQNTVLAEDGRTVVLGGLISNNVNVTVSKVPLLGDIPLLGWLFRSEQTTDRKINLLVFITPSIINDASDLARVSNRNKTMMNRFRAEQMRMPEQPVTLEEDLMQIYQEKHPGRPKAPEN